MYKLLSLLNISQTFPNVEIVHDGVQCLRRAELLKVWNSQRKAAILNGAKNAKHAAGRL